MTDASTEVTHGAVGVGDTTMPDLWVKLHRLARGWSDLWPSDDIEYERGNIDQSSEELLRQLSELDAGLWCTFSEAAGWTPYSAIAVSWCRGATLRHVWKGWLASGADLRPEAASERPARLLNPETLPNTRSFSRITEIAEKQSLVICALLVALEQEIDLDLPFEQLVKAPPQVAAFLLSRSARLRGDHDMTRLRKAWYSTVAGTAYDIAGQASDKSLALH